MHLTSTHQENLYQEIAHLDQIVFEAYNDCNLSVFKTFFAEDMEFYHDKSGLISSREKMLSALEATLFNNSECRTRRELIKDSLEVYPLDNFGAIEIGAHYYYRSTLGKPERCVEVAKFTHIWKKTDNVWKITRVMSYDHRPVGD